MNRKMILPGLLVIGALGAGGFGLYRLGLEQGIANVSVGTAENHGGHAAKSTTDPSSWGIAEGEIATRRHIEAGLRAGDIDPVTGRVILYYQDPMMPGKKFEAPGKSPFMDMMLVPVYAGGANPAGVESDTDTVTVSPRLQQNLGLRVGEVVEGKLMPEIRAVGAVAWNERRQVVVQARATGFVEKLHVQATLDRVSEGQPLFDLYVPDWVAVQQDYLLLRRTQTQGNDLDSLLEAVRQRMRQAGMSAAQIASIEKTGRLQTRMSLYAPRAGVVTELMVREGSTVTPGMTLARITDTDSIWVQAEVPESQTAELREGDPVSAEAAALPGVRFEGQIQALLPEVNPSTRTRKARMELINTERRLVPGMLVHVQLRSTQARSGLLVPTEALIPTGRRTLVMLAEAEGHFRPVEVETGIEQGEQTEIRSGLFKGQKVVVSGQFLLDSAASLRGVEARAGGAP
ncbi:MAG: efflux RND transporter periplasmic adaptor subunit [Gammaproteobacteria bacterium]|nr:efflux RND transporter periplasmic adaptor subunit [Gammaproteobacteria bacterium]